MPTYHGRKAQALLQRESNFKTAPATPAAVKIKFDEISFRDQVDHQENATIEDTALAGKRDISDVGFSGSIKAPLCLNDIGHYLTLLWGLPTTSGTGPYTHTWTLDLSERPTALLELGYTDAGQFRRLLGAAVNSLSWDVLEGDQSLQVEFLAASEVKPRPSAAFDGAPTELARNRACRKGGQIYDVSGANTLGRVAGGSIQVTNDLEAIPLADGSEGYGAYLLGQPAITGEITALLYDGSLMQYAEDHTSVPLELVSRNATGDATLTVSLPAVEFDKPEHSVATSKGLMAKASWRAHGAATAPTITLVNGVATYG